MGAAVQLTRRAKEVAELVALGLTNREIASRLYLSERTIEWHVEQVLNKLGFSSRSQIAAWVGRSQLAAVISVPRERGNLPRQVTSFVGRESDLRAILDLVTANRLTTVTGPGGTGKTRLALRLAEELQADFAHGVWLCDLAPIEQPSLVDDAVAQALQVKRPGRKRLEAVREHLLERTVLLVLDNCEHVLPSAAKLALDLLTACDGVRILATSRKPLGVIGEAIWQLEPLPEEEAIRLFIARASAAVPKFRFEDGNAGTIADICRGLDRVPLAIELIVPRLRFQTPDELLAALHDTAWDGREDSRHGSLYSVAQASYRLMSEAEQSLFRNLGIFSGWFDVHDAVAISRERERATEVDLASLAEQSMVIRQATPPVRYRLLDTLRAFALEKLDRAGELPSIRLSHADHILKMAEQADMIGPDAASRLKLISMVDDVRAALRTLLEARPNSALWLTATLMPAWRYEGRYQEALAWNEKALAASPAPSHQRCRGLFQQALTLADLGQWESLSPWLKEAEAYADQPLNKELRLETLRVRASCYGLVGEYETSFRLGQELIDAFGGPGHEVQLAIALNHTGMCLLSLGRLEEGRVLARRSLQLQGGVTPHRMATLDTLAQGHALLGDLQSARECWLEAVHHGLEIGWKIGIPFCLFGLAYVSGREGDLDRALQLHFVAERLNSVLNLSVSGVAIAAPEAELIDRLSREVEPARLERLHSQTFEPESDFLMELVGTVG